MKRRSFLWIFLMAIAWNSWSQGLDYYPCTNRSSRSDTLVTKSFLDSLARSQSWRLLADVPGMGKEGDTLYAFAVFSDGKKAIAVFNRDGASYLVGWHRPLSRHPNDHHHFSFSYAALFDASIWKGGGSDLSLEQIADSLKTSVLSLNRRNLESIAITKKINQ